MKNKFQLIIIVISLLSFPKVNFGQTVTLGAAEKFALFTKAGAIGDNAVGHSLVTGDIGYENSGAYTGFGNVNGVVHPGVDAATTACGLAVDNIVTQLNGMPATLFPANLIGNGATFVPGIYSITGVTTMNADLILDGQSNSTSLFVIKIQGINGNLNINANAKLKLINGALACNVFWQVDKAVSMASGVSMKGNIVAGGAIGMATLDTLDGRLLATVGAISTDGDLIYTPVGCGSPLLTGPKAPDLASIACYAVFSSNGNLLNTA